MATADRGFASMDPDKQRKIASQGGKAAHEKGTAHEWNSDEAREAGKKGARVRLQRRQASKAAEPSPSDEKRESNEKDGEDVPT